MNPLAALIAVEAGRREALSAQPDAPHLEPAPAGPGSNRSRHLLASCLRALAERLEPSCTPERPLRPCVD